MKGNWRATPQIEAQRSEALRQANIKQPLSQASNQASSSAAAVKERQSYVVCSL
jgi:hypothetical protein